MPKNETPVLISEAEASKWLLFQQYFDPFDTMVKSGVFTVRNGSVSLDFDKTGILKNIRRTDILYSERYGDTRP